MTRKTEFNPFGDVTKIREPYRAEVTYTYNAWGMPSSMAMAGGQIGLFDDRDQLEWTMDPHVTLQLDEAGRLSSVETDFTDDITYRYDAEGRPTSVMYGDQAQYEFNYENQRLSTLVIDDSSTRSFFYDNDHRLARVTDSEQSGNLAAYTYNAEGRVASYADSNQTQLDYSYDNQGRVTKISIDNGPTLQYAYFDNGDLSSVTGQNLSVTFGNYDRGTPGTWTWRSATGAQTFTASLDKGRITSVSSQSFELELTWSGGTDPLITALAKSGPGYGETWALTYGGQNLLKSATMTRSNGDVVTETYATSTAGLPTLVRKLNDTSLIDLTTDQAVAGVHATVLGAAKITYDQRGSIDTLTDKGRTESYTFDGNRQMTELALTRGGTTTDYTCTYDIAGRRIRGNDTKTLGQVVYAWHESRVVAIGSSSTQWTHLIAYGPLGPVFIEDLVGGNDYFIFTDHLGTPFAYQNAATGKVYYTPTSPWGELLAYDDANPAPYESGNVAIPTLPEVPNTKATAVFELPPDSVFGVPPLGLAGHLRDPHTGLVHMHHRIYHPRLGHFLTPDFRAPDIYDPSSFKEPYAYAAGNPMIFWDPDGLDVLTSFRQLEEWKGWFGEENLLIEYVGGSKLSEESRVGFKNERTANAALERILKMTQTGPTWDGINWLWHGIYTKEVRSFTELFPHEPYTERLNTYVSGIGPVPSYTGDFKSPLQVMWYAPEGNEFLTFHLADSEIRSWIRDAAEYHDVPLVLLAVILQQENAPEASGFRQTLQFGERSVTTFLAIMDDIAFDLVPDKIGSSNFAAGSSGFANMSRATLRDAANYTEQYYLKNPLSVSARYRLLGWDQDTRVSGDDWRADLYYAAAHLRQLIDRITNTPRYRGELTPEQIMQIFTAYNGTGVRAEKYGKDAMERIRKAISGEVPLYFFQRAVGRGGK